MGGRIREENSAEEKSERKLKERKRRGREKSGKLIVRGIYKCFTLPCQSMHLGFKVRIS